MRKSTAETGVTGLGEVLLGREAQRVVLLGALVWLTGALLVICGAGALGLEAASREGSIWEVSLIAGFVLSSPTVLIYASLRAVLRPRLVGELLAGGSFCFLPVTAGLVALALLPLEDRFVIPLLGAALLLHLAYLLGTDLVHWDRKSGRLRGSWAALRRALAGLQEKWVGWEWPIPHLHAGARSPGPRGQGAGQNGSRRVRRSGTTDQEASGQMAVRARRKLPPRISSSCRGV